MRGLSLVAASWGHSWSQCVGLSLSWPLLLRSTGSRHAGSVVVAHGPSCSAACGILPDQGSNPCPLHWQADSQPLRHQGSPPFYFLLTFGLFSIWHFHEWSCYKHSYMCLWQLHVFVSLGNILLSGIAGSWSISHSVLVDITKQLSKVVVPVELPPEMYECSGCFTSLPILAVVNPFNFSHSSDKYLRVLICISLMNMCLAALGTSSFVKWLFKPFALFYWLVFFLLICRSSLYILDTSPLSDICILNIFPPFMAFLFTLLIVSSDE